MVHERQARAIRRRREAWDAAAAETPRAGVSSGPPHRQPGLNPLSAPKPHRRSRRLRKCQAAGNPGTHTARPDPEQARRRVKAREAMERRRETRGRRSRSRDRSHPAPPTPGSQGGTSGSQMGPQADTNGPLHKRLTPEKWRATWKIEGRRVAPATNIRSHPAPPPPGSSGSTFGP